MNKEKGKFMFYRLWIKQETETVDFYRLQFIWIRDVREFHNDPILSIEFYYNNSYNVLCRNRIGMIITPITFPVYRMLFLARSTEGIDCSYVQKYWDNYKEWSEFNSTILKYIEDYCNIIDPKII